MKLISNVVKFASVASLILLDFNGLNTDLSNKIVNITQTEIAKKEAKDKIHIELDIKGRAYEDIRKTLLNRLDCNISKFDGTIEDGTILITDKSDSEYEFKNQDMSEELFRNKVNLYITSNGENSGADSILSSIFNSSFLQIYNTVIAGDESLAKSVYVPSEDSIYYDDVLAYVMYQISGTLSGDTDVYNLVENKDIYLNDAKEFMSKCSQLDDDSMKDTAYANKGIFILPEIVLYNYRLAMTSSKLVIEHTGYDMYESFNIVYNSQDEYTNDIAQEVIADVRGFSRKSMCPNKHSNGLTCSDEIKGIDSNSILPLE